MNSKKWLLNPTAIKAARVCIKAVQEELGVKLTLSHPKFLELLRDYCELTDSEKLKESYLQLLKLSDNDAIPEDGVVPIVQSSSQDRFQAVKQLMGSEANLEEWVEYRGKRYLKRLEDRDFKGLYRGQPVYG